MSGLHLDPRNLLSGSPGGGDEPPSLFWGQNTSTSESRGVCGILINWELCARAIHLSPSVSGLKSDTDMISRWFWLSQTDREPFKSFKLPPTCLQPEVPFGWLILDCGALDCAN